MRGGFSGAPVSAATSRATPKTLRTWPRLGVSLSVKSVSSSCRWPRRSAPTGAASSRISRPPWSSESLSSRAEHSMPWLSTPRSLPSLMRNGLVALARRRQLGADQRQRHLDAGAHVRRAADDVRAARRRRRPPGRRAAGRRSGCLATSSTSPTTTPWNGGATGRRSLDLQAGHRQPVGELGGRDRRVAELAQPGLGELHVVSSAGGQAELAQEAQVAVEEQAQVVDAVAQHRQPVDARAEGEADDALGVEAHVAHHLRMHLARARDLEPAAGQRAALEHDVDLGARLGEREVARAEAQRSSSVSKKARMKSRYTAFRSRKLTFSPSHRPSTWWNIGECVASLSTR